MLSNSSRKGLAADTIGLLVLCDWVPAPQIMHGPLGVKEGLVQVMVVVLRVGKLITLRSGISSGVRLL
eukprot:8676513-Heterocapsa_arctica.AAC.1